MSRNHVSNPLITFALFAYNQEKYILEAIHGAISQTYRPLEIILSDDCSSDKTYDIMQQTVASYSGDAKIRINRTQANSGLIGHINSVVKIANGDLIVIAAGDDISESNRVELIEKRWRNANYSSGSIFSQYLAITENGKSIGIGGSESFRTPDSWLGIRDRESLLFKSYPGCTQAFTPNVFEIFGDLQEGILQDDISIQMRSALIGGVGFIRSPLVRYRMTPISASRNGVQDWKSRIAKAVRYHQSFVRVWDQFEADCERAHTLGFIHNHLLEWARKEKRRIVKRDIDEIRFLSSGLAGRLKISLSSEIPFRCRLKFLFCTFFPQYYGYRSAKRTRTA